nr:hypothetical protein [Bacteroidota bacterium]
MTTKRKSSNDTKIVDINRESNPQRELIDNVKIALAMDYEFRYNAITGKAEFRPTAKQTEFQELEDYEFNSILFGIKSWGYKVNPDFLYRLLASDYIDKINPIKNWIIASKRQIPNFDYLRDLASCFKVSNQVKWYEHFQKWFVAMVANIFEDNRCANHTCLVLTGDQGKFKTSALNNLVPDELKQYLYIGKIDPKNKDSLMLLTNKLLINIDDQLKQINRKDENDIKELITKDFVTFRRPYGRFDITRPHIASFCASVNGNDFLTDMTGSRRFLAFEVKEINVEKQKSIDHSCVYAQAYELYKSGFRYWFNDSEIQELNELNEYFASTPVELELIQDLFNLDEADKNMLDFYTSTNVLRTIEIHT